MAMIKNDDGRTFVSDITVYAPMNGEAVSLTDVPDEIFAGGVLGQGAAILPSEGRVYSPADAVVYSIFHKNYAVILQTESGAEILIHVGLGTENLKDGYFQAEVQAEQKVKKGDLLITFDLEKTRREIETITTVLLINADSYASISMLKQPGPVKTGEPLYEAKA